MSSLGKTHSARGHRGGTRYHRRPSLKWTCLTGGQTPWCAEASSLRQLQQDQCPRRREPKVQDLSRPLRNPVHVIQVKFSAWQQWRLLSQAGGQGMEHKPPCHAVNEVGITPIPGASWQWAPRGAARPPSQGARRLGRARAGGEILLPFGSHQRDKSSPFSYSLGRGGPKDTLKYLGRTFVNYIKLHLQGDPLGEQRPEWEKTKRQS